MSDDFAAAQVFDLKAQVTVPLIGLKQRVVGVRSEVLQENTKMFVELETKDISTHQHCFPDGVLLSPLILSTLSQTDGGI